MYITVTYGPMWLFTGQSWALTKDFFLSGQDWCVEKWVDVVLSDMPFKKSTKIEHEWCDVHVWCHAFMIKSIPNKHWDWSTSFPVYYYRQASSKMFRIALSHYQRNNFFWVTFSLYHYMKLTISQVLSIFQAPKLYISALTAILYTFMTQTKPFR